MQSLFVWKAKAIFIEFLAGYNTICDGLAR